MATDESSSTIARSSSGEGTQQTKQSTSPSKRKESIFPTVLLKRNRQSKSFWDGSQLVFPGSIDKLLDGHAAETLGMASFVQVEVPSSNDATNKQTQVVGWGVYNPSSMYRVRILCHSRAKNSLSQQLARLSSPSRPTADDEMEANSKHGSSAISAVLDTKLEKALRTRQAMGLQTSSPTQPNTSLMSTDTFRLVNGEGDGLSGLAVDIIGNQVAVVMSSAAWCQIYQSEIETALRQLLPDHYDVVWKTTPARLEQDGYNTQKYENNNDRDDKYDQMILATENGVKFQTFPYQEHGQKTSFYCDQRENRFQLAQFCSGKHVLDLCCYHGGFALYAMLQNAASVVGVDSSQDAVDTSHANAKLNGFVKDDQDNAKITFVRREISEYMQQLSASNDDRPAQGQTSFDVIILDPPKLAPSASSLSKATRKYHSLNRDALKLINEKDGGLFLTCTCSAAMTQKDGGTYFLQTVQQAGLAAGREVTLVRVSGAASCHTQSPASNPAGNYLTAALFYVHPKET